ncbi:MAG TPA: hypothetical protein VFJ87_07610 [Rhodanobacteraceae bacterium]|nr:hypothetical protein [Rhodanobacteraceae bacterium]
MLRLLRRNPDRIRMDRLADYMREFARLVGLENQPVFRGVRRASTGLKVAVPASRQKAAFLRIREAHARPDSKPAVALRCIETLMGEDAISKAELLDSSRKVVYLFHAPVLSDVVDARIQQAGEVDGIITGIVGADDTMHLYLRDHLGRDLRLIVRSEDLARALLSRFRLGVVRLSIHGTWIRTDRGWIPESNKCTVDRFEMLDDTSPLEIFEGLGSIAGNGWNEVSDADAAWRDLRGLQ